MGERENFGFPQPNGEKGMEGVPRDVEKKVREAMERDHQAAVDFAKASGKKLETLPPKDIKKTVEEAMARDNQAAIDFAKASGQELIKGKLEKKEPGKVTKFPGTEKPEETREDRAA